MPQTHTDPIDTELLMGSRPTDAEWEAAERDLLRTQPTCHPITAADFAAAWRALRPHAQAAQ